MEIWLPVTEPPKFTCRVPVAEGEVCGKKFLARERSLFEKHVRECCEANLQAIHSEKPSVKLDVLHGIADKELKEWLDRDGGANSRAVMEGRKRLS